jgi:hypothetical protein
MIQKILVIDGVNHLLKKDPSFLGDLQDIPKHFAGRTFPFFLGSLIILLTIAKLFCLKEALRSNLEKRF